MIAALRGFYESPFWPGLGLPATSALTPISVVERTQSAALGDQASASEGCALTLLSRAHPHIWRDLRLLGQPDDVN